MAGANFGVRYCDQHWPADVPIQLGFCRLSVEASPSADRRPAERQSVSTRLERVSLDELARAAASVRQKLGQGTPHVLASSQFDAMGGRDRCS
jgi:hypothetical protein